MHIGTNREFSLAKGQSSRLKLEALFAVLVAHLAGAEDRQFGVLRDGRQKCLPVNLGPYVDLAAVKSAVKSIEAVECGSSTPRFCIAYGKDDLEVDLVLHRVGKRWALKSPSKAYSFEMLRVFSGFLQRLSLARDNVSLQSISLLGDDMAADLLSQLNRTARPHAIVDPLKALETNAARTPDGVALIEGETQLTFGDLARQVHSLSAHLQEQTDVGDVIGVCLPRGTQSVISLLAIWHAGLVWLPIPPSVPAPHRASMLSVGGANAVLTLRSLGVKAEKTICVDDVKNAAADRRTTGIETDAAVMFTSGTTGTPNGVRHSHRALSNRFGWWVNMHPAATDDVYMHRTAMNFIPSLTEMVSGVLAGRPLVVLNERDASDPEKIAQSIATNTVTRVAVLPSLLRKMLDGLGDNASELQSLRLVTSAGEPCEMSLVQEFQTLAPRCEVLNDYGCTETNGVLVASSKDAPKGAKRLPAGRPIPNCMAVVLTHADQIAPKGLEGELCVAGMGVGEGYVDAEALNLRRFTTLQVPDAAVPSGELRLFRTRDRARVLPCGQIEVLGRLDNVLKIRGIRIEIESTEVELQALPEVADAACGPVTGANGAVHLGCWIVWNPSAKALTDTDLRQRLVERLPEAGIPTRIFAVKSLPRTPNGKLGRARLQDMKTIQTPVVKPNIVAAQTGEDVGVIRSISKILARVLDVAETSIDLHKDFKLLGLDSLSVVDFVQGLSEELGKNISVGMPFDCVTPQRLAEKLSNDGAPRTQNTRSNVGVSDIAVVGMACRMPKAADVAAFWSLLKSGQSGVTEIPMRRWNWRDHAGPDQDSKGRSDSRWGGFIDNEDMFDPMFFNISPREAAVMSPEQRLFLETCWHGLADAGLTNTSVAGRKIGVFAGVRQSDYGEHLAAEGVVPDSQTLMGLDSAILAARISYFLDLKGPALTLDTACSSSLVAIHQAARSLRDGESELALAGGVSLVTSPTQYIQNTRAGMLSPDGRCATFSDGANGFVQGEGCGVVVLKPLEQAIQDGDQIYSVLKASGINQDGRSNGMTAPNGDAQRALIEQVHAESGAASSAIELIEAHGTGTPLGDPIEFEALRDIFEAAQARHNGCALGSVKTNIGHLIAAAGIAGFIKASLSLHHKFIPATLNFERPNQHIDVENSPFFIPTTGRDWEQSDTPKRATVSAFGFSGTNCHVVLEQFKSPQQPTPSVEEHPALVLLSASSQEAMALQARTLADHLDSAKTTSLFDVALTLSRRLNVLPYVAAIWCDDASGLAAALNDLADGASSPLVLFSGPQSTKPSAPDLAMFGATLVQEAMDGTRAMDRNWADALARLFSIGETVDLCKIYQAKGARVCSLPPAPFVSQSYWVGQRARDLSGALKIPPELCADHKVQNKLWVPAAALIMGALATRDQTKAHRITDLALVSAIEVSAGQGADLALVSVVNGDATGLEWRYGDQLRARANLLPIDGLTPPKVAPTTLRKLLATLGEAVGQTAFYARCRISGLDYGPIFRAVQRQHHTASRSIAFLEAPTEAQKDNQTLVTAMFDAALHTLVSLTPDGELAVPVGAGQVDVYAPIPPRMIVVAEITERSGMTLTANLQLLTEDGAIVSKINDLRLQVLTGRGGETPRSATFDRCEIGAWTRKLVNAQNAVTVPQFTEIQDLSVHPIHADLPQKRTSDFAIWRSQSTSIEMLIEEFTMHVRTLTTTNKTVRLIAETGGLVGGGAALAAAARSARAEHPRLHVKTVIRAAETLSADDYRFEGIVSDVASRWQACAIDVAVPPSVGSGSVCLVTGGLGGVGHKLVEWLAQSNNKRVALATHRPLNDQEQQWIKSLRDVGTEVVAYEADLTDMAACTSLLRKIEMRFGRLDRVYHCAGITSDALIGNKTRAQIDTVMAAKVRTIETLDASLGNTALEQMVLFSSISAVIGTPGQADYAAANAWLDDFAERRNQDDDRLGQTLSINWALMADGRMSPPASELKRLRKRHGMAPLPSNEGFKTMEALAAAGHSQAVVAYGDPDQLDAWINAELYYQTSGTVQ